MRSGSPDGRLGRLFGFARGAVATGAALAWMGLSALRDRARPLVEALERLGRDGTGTDGEDAGGGPAWEQERNVTTKARVKKAVKTAVARAASAAKGVVGTARSADEETPAAMKPAAKATAQAKPGKAAKAAAPAKPSPAAKPSAGPAEVAPAKPAAPARASATRAAAPAKATPSPAPSSAAPAQKGGLDTGGPSARVADATGPGETPLGDTAGRGAQATVELQHVALSIPPRPDGGAPEPAARAARAEPEHIPWGYGRDRVTAAAIDPDRLYVYWEATDEGIAHARAALGPAGAEAWLVVRVSDVTGVLFDGTNAHHSFDHRVERGDRQWFFGVNRPTSSVVVELGLRSAAGGFARLARSSRVEFPRTEPIAWAPPEWMTVVAETGEVRPAGTGAPGWPAAGSGQGPADRFVGGPGPGAEDDRHAPSFSPIPLWIVRDPVSGHAAWVRELTDHGWERVEWQEVHGEGWFELLGRVEWQGPRTVTSWEAGPFSDPVEVQPPTHEAWEGSSVAYQVGGVTRVVHGPWQVVIRNLGAHASRQVLGTWRVFRSWVTDGGKEVQQAPAARSRPAPGASEQVLVGGASERAWAGGSELRLGGASEVWRLGASEVRFAGASERLLAGASERIVRGASEQVARGASEWAQRGGSEQVLRGASERVQQGASERMLGGASERVYQGASERALGGASERARQGASERMHQAASERRPNPYPEAE